MTAIVTCEPAKVYRGGGRRWFTLNAAARAEARRLVKARCECEEGDSVTPGMPCHYHRDPERYAEIITRLARFILRSYRGTP